jgi:hypothetical protein
MSPTKAIVLGLILNVTTVVAMERVRNLWRGAPPAFAAEALAWCVVIAVTIVGAQFCIIAASLADGFPMYVAIGLVIALVLTIATLNGCRSSGRWPTGVESIALVALIVAAFVLQYVSHRAEISHLDRQNRPARQHEI